MREFAATQVFGERLGAGAVKGRRMGAGRWRMDGDGWVGGCGRRQRSRRRPRAGLSAAGDQRRGRLDSQRDTASDLCSPLPQRLSERHRRPIRSFRCSHTCLRRHARRRSTPLPACASATASLQLELPPARGPRNGAAALSLVPSGPQGRARKARHACRARVAEKGSGLRATYSSVDKVCHVAEGASYRMGGLGDGTRRDA